MKKNHWILGRGGMTMSQKLCYITTNVAKVLDNTEVLKELYEKLAKHRVIPYYAHWGVFAPGIRHFAIDGYRARQLIRKLENRTSGFCIPHLITLDQKNNKVRTLG